MFDVVRFSKQCRSGYINTVRCLPASDAKSCVCLAYDNEQTLGALEKLVQTSPSYIFLFNPSYPECPNLSPSPWKLPPPSRNITVTIHLHHQQFGASTAPILARYGCWWSRDVPREEVLLIKLMQNGRSCISNFTIWKGLNWRKSARQPAFAALIDTLYLALSHAPHHPAALLLCDFFSFFLSSFLLLLIPPFASLWYISGKWHQPFWLATCPGFPLGKAYFSMIPSYICTN